MAIVFVIFRFSNMSFGIRCYELPMFNNFPATTHVFYGKLMKLLYYVYYEYNLIIKFFVNSLKLNSWQIADNSTITSLLNLSRSLSRILIFPSRFKEITD